MNLQETKGSLEGLDSATAAALLAQHGYNALPQVKRRNLVRIVLSVVTDPMFLLLLACAGIYLLLGEPGESLLLLVAVVVVIGLTVFQERRTERALDALRVLTSPRSRVLRDGQWRRIPARELVPGDIVKLGEGDRVPADGVLLSATVLSVDESTLTGESVPVLKTPDGDSAMAFGTLSVQGQGLMRVLATGSATRIGKLGGTLASVERPDSPLRRETRLVVRWLAAGALLFCLLAALAYGISGHAWLESLLAGLTLAMSILPEEFPVVLAVLLAFGAWRIARHRVLTRRTNALETLGSVTVLCVDKTGTLTENRMQLVGLHDGDSLCELESGSALMPSHRRLLEAALLASHAHPVDPLEQALHVAWQETGGNALPFPAEEPVADFPLTRERLAVIKAWPGSNGTFDVMAKGAPETIADLAALDEQRRATVLEQAATLAQRGWRLLGVAHARAASIPDDPASFSFAWLGLIALRDPLRTTVPAAVAQCRSAGIRVVMVTGDFRETAQSVAGEIGLEGIDRAISGDELEHSDELALAGRLASTGVCYRVAPEQKLRIVRAMQMHGDIVAMTGDGVNDAPALRAADIGIAMGERGTDVAREAADFILTDDRFESIVLAVRYGRNLFDNLARAVVFIIAVHVPIVGLAILPLVAGTPLMLFPVHVMLLELLIDPACSLSFEAEPEERGVMQRPPRPAHARLFNTGTVLRGLVQGASAFACVALVFMIGAGRGLEEDALRAASFSALMMGNAALLFANGTRGFALRHGNPVALVVAGLALLALAASLLIPTMRGWFHFQLPDPAVIGLTLGAVGVLTLWLVVLRAWWPKWMHQATYRRLKPEPTCNE